MASIAHSAIPSYRKKKRHNVTTEGLPPKDRYFLMMIEELVSADRGEQFFYDALEMYDDKQQKHRMKVFITKLLSGFADKEQLKFNNKLDEIYNQLVPE
jgi:hypothetical protein